MTNKELIMSIIEQLQFYDNGEARRQFIQNEYHF